jgi:hypothetical protein
MDSDSWDFSQSSAGKNTNQDKRRGLLKRLGPKLPSFRLSERAENMIVRAVVLVGDSIPDEITGGTQSLRCAGRKELPACSLECDCLC